MLKIIGDDILDIYSNCIDVEVEVETDDDIIYVEIGIGISVGSIDEDSVDFCYTGEITFADENVSEEIKSLINEEYDNIICRNISEIEEELRKIFHKEEYYECSDYDYERAEHQYCWDHDLA